MNIYFILKSRVEEVVLTSEYRYIIMKKGLPCPSNVACVMAVILS